jgi:hypothetical protein
VRARGEVEVERGHPAWRHAAALLVVLAYLLLTGLTASPYDDSFFFKRIALHFLAGHGFSWNVTDGPVHGLTSQLFGLLAVPLTWLWPNHFVLASKLCLAASFALLVGLSVRFAVRAAVPAAQAGVLLLLAFGTPLALLEPHTGMETSLCLAVLAVALGQIVLGAERASSPGEGAAYAACSALLTALVYTCRPDAALLPALTFMVLQRRNRVNLLGFGALLALSMGGLWAAFHAYYGSALPLSFYAKTAGLSAFDSELRHAGVPGKVQHLLTFAAFSAPLAWLALRGEDARVRALLAASATFIAYQALLTDEIMGYRARFYMPAIVPLAFAALLAWPRARARIRPAEAFRAWLVWASAIFVAYALGGVERGRSALEGVPFGAYAVALVLGVLLCDGLRQTPRLSARNATWASIGALAFGAACLQAPRLPRASLTDAAFLRRASDEVTTTRGLFEVARCISGPQTLYHSEIGIPGLVLPDWRVVDLVGLMSNELAQHRPPFDEYCRRDRPAVLFLPHKNYRALNAEIRESACLREYTLAVRDSSSPLYIRSDLSPAFNACRRDAWRVP